MKHDDAAKKAAEEGQNSAEMKKAPQPAVPFDNKKNKSNLGKMPKIQNEPLPKANLSLSKQIELSDDNVFKYNTYFQKKYHK